eukprot:scaffold2384_cov120-Isochrysis_galbana.AAC.7
MVWEGTRRAGRMHMCSRTPGWRAPRPARGPGYAIRSAGPCAVALATRQRHAFVNSREVINNDA